MPQAKLTAEQQDDLARRYSTGESPSRLAEEFGVCNQTVLNAAKRHDYGPPAPRRLLSIEDEAALTAAYQTGERTGALAERFGIHKAQVAKIVRRVGGEVRRKGVRPITDAQETELAQLYAGGASTKALAARFGVLACTVVDIARRNGCEIRGQGGPREWNEDQISEISSLWQSGESQTSIAQAYGTTQITISRVLRSAGVEPSPRQRRPRGADHGSWKGGRVLMNGYPAVMVDPADSMGSMRNHTGYVLEHRLVMARALGRPLDPRETVHHISGDITDCRIENLQLRQGRHGKGVVMVCQDCGSQNIVSTVIADEADGDLVLFD